ncbi:MAG TPA: hypothetical protein VLW50_24975 [Streptosporangiaceae bacterium]|nr:hypothetical protein [Streptosporangiaceae bacterium]
MSGDDIADRPQPRDLADRAAESIRALNHLTPDALEYPGDLYDVIARLKVMAQRLPQLFGQLSAWLELEYAAGRIAHDSGQAPERYVKGVTDSLTLAAMGGSALADALDTAHNACSGLKAAHPGAEDRPAERAGGS